MVQRARSCDPTCHAGLPACPRVGHQGKRLTTGLVTRPAARDFSLSLVKRVYRLPGGVTSLAVRSE